MKATGINITPAESRHFNSLARHVGTYAKSIAADMRVCEEADWAGMDRAYIEGKLADLQGNLRAIQQVLADMLPIWESEQGRPGEQPPTSKHIEIRLYEPQWKHLDELRAAIPTLWEKYDAPNSDRVTDTEVIPGPAVKVFDALLKDVSAPALALLTELQIEHTIDDVRLPQQIEEW